MIKEQGKSERLKNQKGLKQWVLFALCCFAVSGEMAYNTCGMV